MLKLGFGVVDCWWGLFGFCFCLFGLLCRTWLIVVIFELDCLYDVLLTCDFVITWSVGWFACYCCCFIFCWLIYFKCCVLLVLLFTGLIVCYTCWGCLRILVVCVVCVLCCWFYLICLEVWIPVLIGFVFMFCFVGLLLVICVFDCCLWVVLCWRLLVGVYAMCFYWFGGCLWFLLFGLFYCLLIALGSCWFVCAITAGMITALILLIMMVYLRV